LALIARPRGGDWLSDDLLTSRRLGFDVIVSLLRKDESNELGLTEEGSLAVGHGLDFINFPIRDYDVPESMSATFELSKELLHRLKAGKTVGIHCRQSVGRAPLIAACLYVLAGESPELAFKKIETARRVPVPDTIEQKEFVSAFAATLISTE
jgi:protein-tyrosine phosphatase